MEDNERRDLWTAIEANRVRTESAVIDIKVLQSQYMGILRMIDDKLSDARADMQNLQQELRHGTETTKDLSNTVRHMQISSARDKGYWLGVGGAGIVAMQVLWTVIEKFVIH